MGTKIFLKLGDIKGTCQDDNKHKDWIEIESFGYGVSNGINCVEKAKGNPGGEACIHSDVSLTKTIDKTSTQLYAFSSAGKMFKEAIIDVCEEEESLFKMTLTNPAISSASVSGGVGGVPSESVVLAFSKIAWQYKTEAPQDWCQVTNKGSLKKK